MRYEVTLCRRVNRIQCEEREVSNGSGQRVNKAGGLGAGQRVEGWTDMVGFHGGGTHRCNVSNLEGV